MFCGLSRKCRTWTQALHTCCSTRGGTWVRPGTCLVSEDAHPRTRATLTRNSTPTWRRCVVSCRLFAHVTSPCYWHFSNLFCLHNNSLAKHFVSTWFGSIGFWWFKILIYYGFKLLNSVNQSFHLLGKVN